MPSLLNVKIDSFSNGLKVEMNLKKNKTKN